MMLHSLRYNTKCKYIAKERPKDSNALLANSIMCYQKKKVKYTKQFSVNLNYIKQGKKLSYKSYFKITSKKKQFDFLQIFHSESIIDTISTNDMSIPRIVAKSLLIAKKKNEV